MSIFVYGLSITLECASHTRRSGFLFCFCRVARLVLASALERIGARATTKSSQRDQLSASSPTSRSRINQAPSPPPPSLLLLLPPPPRSHRWHDNAIEVSETSKCRLPFADCKLRAAALDKRRSVVGRRAACRDWRGAYNHFCEANATIMQQQPRREKATAAAAMTTTSINE